jgi:hypothetical protein
MLISVKRKLARRTPVYDHANVLLFEVDRDQARDMMTRPHIDVIWTRNDMRVRALRFHAPEAPAKPSDGRRRKGAGEPVRYETDSNPKGVVHFKHIPVSCQPHFVAVVQQCLKA